MIVRAAVMDELVMRSIREDGVTQVLNLAAGFDARPWRLDLPRDLRWIDVDHPAMLDEKAAALSKEPTRCAYEAVRLDLADRDARRLLFTRLAADGRRTLVISEGLLVDLASPGLLKMMRRSRGKAVEAGNAPFRFGPEDHTAFFVPSGWKEREWRPMVEEGIRLRRIFAGARLWMFVGRFFPARKREEFRRSSGVALLERLSG